MKNKSIILAMAITVIFSLIVTRSGQADDVSLYYLTPFTTSITYQNVGTSATTSLSFTFYNSEFANGTYTYTPSSQQLAQYASGSYSLQSSSGTKGGFNGGAKVLSDQTILLTLVQVPHGQRDTIVRPISNGFTSGSTTVYIPSLIKKTYNVYTSFSIQNVGTVQTTATITVYNLNGSTYKTWPELINAGGAYYFDASSDPNLRNDPSNNNDTFEGSAIITSNPAPIIVTVMEKDYVDNGSGAKAFEGFSSGALFFYMPTASCSYYGQTSAYAVQNIGTSPTTVTVYYSDGKSAVPQSIPAKGKYSFNGCTNPTHNPGFNGSANIISSNSNIVVVIKNYGNGASGAYNAVTSGSSKQALPYVRWATDSDFTYALGYQRTYIAIQNLSNQDQPANTVTVSYIKYDGSTIGTYTYPNIIPSKGKFSTSFPDTGQNGDFGYYGGTYGGGAVIVCTGSPCNLTTMARVVSPTYSGGTVSEDYNGRPIP